MENPRTQPKLDNWFSRQKGIEKKNVATQNESSWPTLTEVQEDHGPTDCWGVGNWQVTELPTLWNAATTNQPTNRRRPLLNQVSKTMDRCVFPGQTFPPDSANQQDRVGVGTVTSVQLYLVCSTPPAYLFSGSVQPSIRLTSRRRRARCVSNWTEGLWCALMVMRA